MTMNTTFKRIFVGQNLGAFVMSSMLFNEKKVTCCICVCDSNDSEDALLRSHKTQLYFLQE